MCMTTIYAAMREELLVATGDDWNATRQFVKHDLQCVAAHPDESERVFVGTF